MTEQISLARRFSTYFALGPLNLVRVAAYRIGLRLRIHPVLRARFRTVPGPFFLCCGVSKSQAVPRQTWRDSLSYFSYHRFPLSGVPDWHVNPFRPGARADEHAHWSSIPDFTTAIGDIKAIWEASRFDWLIAMAQRAALGDEVEFERLNAWLEDWFKANQPYMGVNWKCGQEASIRVMQLATAALIFKKMKPLAPALRAFIAAHLKRIAPTIGYAIGQANNHGTSEAAALFIGGSWLGGREGERRAAVGRRWLEDRAVRLIASDGTFSQYSIVYHRLMLDTYALAEIWRRAFNLPAFSPALYERMRLATLWFRNMVVTESGDAPNLGANDGAKLLSLTDADYRDFRPSLQLASALFLDARAIPTSGVWDQQLAWLGVRPPDCILPPPQSISLDEGGFHILRAGAAMALLRYPRFRFRPSQADALHLDLWLNGRNLLRDAGSFSYGGDDGVWFSGTSAHNTIEFDDRDQMPRIGRFLFGAWLKAEGVDLVKKCGENAVSAAAGYRDMWGAQHHRQVVLRRDGLDCVDKLSGSARKAVLRWRLAPGDWNLSGNTLSLGQIRLNLSSDRPVALKLTCAPESRYYLHREDVPVLELETTPPATIRTHVTF
ncbi:heparinase II/III family protein [Sphingopyxis flava]|uniref:Heparinase II/III N-terminus n=1 Tax=Sphingopyxis flava TaxID=1507287 RepID=A0A1T5F650_9SPHN|nr:heparinase II/III-family protein [Sphingopyxis flava]SKB91637.1 Heparinase II/III N-terminus [Sphingopyxis flava]